MSRDNVVYTICGLLLGLIIGSFLIGPRLAKTRLAGAPGQQEPVAAAQAPSSSPMQGDPKMMEQVRRRLDALKQTVERDPNDFDALAQLGAMYMDAAKYPQAIDYFERALRVRSDANVRADLAICYQQSGRTDRALAELQRVVRDDPNQWQARFNEIVLLGEMRRFDEARAELAKLKRQRPDDSDIQRLEQALAAGK
jgi:tetratricopeptide (TPR) repeat protein